MNDLRAMPGLCPRCRNVRVIRNRRGSVFLLCRLSADDPAYRRYPPQPVAACPGFEPAPCDPADSAPSGTKG